MHVHTSVCGWVGVDRVASHHPPALQNLNYEILQHWLAKHILLKFFLLKLSRNTACIQSIVITMMCYNSHASQSLTSHSGSKPCTNLPQAQKGCLSLYTLTFIIRAQIAPESISEHLN